MNKRDFLTGLIAFCLTIALFLAIPTRSNPTSVEYDPWADINGDGKINTYDIGYTAQRFGATGTPINRTALLLGTNTILPALYAAAKDSVVMIVGETATGTVQGSGFVYNYSGTMVVLTNNHVVYETASLSVTFSDGDGYGATVRGTDPYADFAVVTVNSAPSSEFKPIMIGNSTALSVGDPVIAIGNPYGLAGSLTTGVISALNRTIDESEYTGGFAIANVIQTSAPINPGNSGGPLINLDGRVIGITTAIVADSTGLGFAVPSNTLLKEIAALMANGTYTAHSYLGVSGTDMDYYTAQEIDSTVTYGWRLGTITPSGPSDGKLRVDDIIIALNGTRIRNGDDLMSYLEASTLPGETIRVQIMRANVATEVPIVLGARPAPPI